MRTAHTPAGRFVALGMLAILLSAGFATGQERSKDKSKVPATTDKSRSVPRRPYYSGKPGDKATPAPLPAPLDLRNKSLDQRIGLVRERAEWRSSGDSPVSILNMAGCMHCHASLDGISVRTFQRHVESRFSRCAAGGRAIGGSEVLAAYLSQDGSPQQKLKESIDAAGGNIRPAGTMAAEMAREKWEAARRAAEAKDAEVAKSDYEKAIELIAATKYPQALPLLKAHIAAENARLAEQSKRAVADATKTTTASTPKTDSMTSPGGNGTGNAAADEHLVSPAELEDTRRVLAFVLLGSGQPDAASAIVREMYRQDPQLARRALKLESFGVAERDLHAQFAASVTFANKARTGSSWLMAAMLAQAEDRLPLARTMIEKGVAVGLDRDIADAFAVAIQESILSRAAERRGHKETPSPSPAPAVDPSGGSPAAPAPK